MNAKVFLIGFFFGLGETWYFGWNFLPSSDAELICDGIALLIVALAFVVPKRAAGEAIHVDRAATLHKTHLRRTRLGLDD